MAQKVARVVVIVWEQPARLFNCCETLPLSLCNAKLSPVSFPARHLLSTLVLVLTFAPSSPRMRSQSGARGRAARGMLATATTTTAAAAAKKLRDLIRLI